MTIKCAICECGRDKAFIGVFRDIFYCIDKPECVAKAKTLRRIAERLGRPDPMAHLKVLTHGHEKKSGAEDQIELFALTAVARRRGEKNKRNLL